MGRGGGGGGSSRFLNYGTEISWEWERLACPASLEDIAMRFQAKLRNTPPQFGSSRLRGVPCNRAVGTGTKQPTPWTLFPERETENPEFRVGENCRRLASTLTVIDVIVPRNFPNRRKCLNKLKIEVQENELNSSR